MHRIDSATASPDENGTGKSGWTEGNPLTATPPTGGASAWFNSVQEELAGVIEGAGVALAKADNGQLDEAIGLKIDAAIATKVTGPASATDGAIAGFDDVTGKLVKESGLVMSAGELAYVTPKARSALLPIFDALAYDSTTGAASTIGISLDAGLDVSHIVVATGKRASIPVRLRTGCVITSVDFMHGNTAASGLLSLMKREPDFAAPNRGPAAAIGAVSPNAGVTTVATISGLSYVVDGESETMWVDLESGSGTLSVHAVRVNYTDPGPRNF